MYASSRANPNFATPNPPRARMANHSRQASRTTAGIVHSAGRGEVATPQAVITLQATLPKNERARRASTVDAGRPESMYAPPASHESEFDATKGMVGICLLNRAASFGGRIGNDSSVRVATNMAGLSRNEKLGMPCVVQVARQAIDMNSDDRTTIIVQGVQTIINSGQEDVSAGQIVILDPNPYLVEGDSAGAAPVCGITVAGSSPNVMMPQTRTLDSSNQHTMVQRFLDRARVAMGRASFGKAVAACFASSSAADDLAALFQRVCAELYAASNMAEDIPLRGITAIWMPFYFVKMIKMGQVACVSSGAIGSTLFIALRAWLEVMKRVESAFSRNLANYDISLPHDTSDQRPAMYAAHLNQSSLYGTEINKLLTQEHMVGLATDFERSQAMFKAEASLDLQYDYYSSVLRYDLSDYLRKFSLGISLLSAHRGGPLDVLLGGH